jgi:hypothetical protein
MPATAASGFDCSVFHDSKDPSVFVGCCANIDPPDADPLFHSVIDDDLASVGIFLAATDHADR